MLKKVPCVTLILSVFLFILLFANVNFASAQENADSRECGSIDIIRLIPSPYSLIPSPSLNADSDKELSEDGSRVAMFRLYNQWTGEHFYTSSTSERDSIVKKGWTYEEIGWYAPTQLKTVPVYRLYNPYVEGGDHHYTTSAEERDYDVKAGWSYEGIAWYSVPDNVKERVPVLRQYNPYAKTGTHNYTTAQKENDHLVSLGWMAEGIGWYGYDTIEPTTQAIDFTKAVVDQSDKTYNSKAFTPSATVTGLTAGTDYTVTYKDNVNAGTGKITIAGKGSYTGSKVYSFKINPLNISTNSSVTLGTSLTYNAYEQAQTVAKVTASGLTLSASDYTLTNNKGTNAGEYKLKVTGKGNFTGEVSKTFTISKATPEAPANLTTIAKTGTTLDDVELPDLPEGFDGTIAWKDQSVSVGDEEKTIEAVAIYTPKDTANYKTVEVKVAVSVTENVYTIVFHGNGGTDSSGNDSYLQICERDKSYTFFDNDFSLSGKKFAFWGNNEETSESSSTYVNEHSIYNFAAKGETVHVYVHWVDETLGNYWVGGARDANPGIAESVTKTQSEIDASKEDQSFWQTQMDADARLYTIWNYDETTNFTNRFVEFRIIQVGEHDSDGSVVTFMASHSIPSGQGINSTHTNAGGWVGSKMYQEMNVAGGSVMTGLSGLASSVKPVVKKSTTGSYADGWTSTTSTDTFWLVSQSEIYEKYTEYGLFREEGSSYPWIIANATSTDLDGLDERRDGTDTYSDFHNWWTRSPLIKDNYEWGSVTKDFGCGFYNGAKTSYGVVPCFCF